MSSPFAHAAVAVALGQAAPPERRSERRFWLAAVSCAILPDADHFWLRSGPWYEQWMRFGTGTTPLLFHRGLTHSLCFAAGAGLLAAAFFRPEWRREGWKLAVLLAVITASHGLLDGFTDGDLGIAYFSPFSRARLLSPWRPLGVIGSARGYFSLRGLRALAGEAFWVGLPCALVVSLVRQRRSQC